MSRALYFAYGSNLSTRRLVARVPSAAAVGRARLRDYAFRLDKPGRDGSAKANLVAEPGAAVWGVLFSLEASEWPRLDACEGGYRRIAVSLQTEGGPVERAETYLSDRRDAEPLAFPSYVAWMIEGAREHALPEPWCAMLAGLPTRPEPDDAT